MITSLIEFNSGNEVLRGIMTGNAKNKKIVIMLAGFERAGTTERKFKLLADELNKKNISAFRFDAPDCGLSDGDFYQMSIEKMAHNLESAVKYLKKIGYNNFSVVGHSLAACAISLLLDKNLFNKIILIAPGLNQKDLLRLWFVQKNNKGTEITWNNYLDYLKEKHFIKNLKFDLTTKSHKLHHSYREYNQDKDYSSRFINFSDKVLLIHGNSDYIVPLASLNCKFNQQIIIDKGDHDLERPEIIEQWLEKAVCFLAS